MNMRFLTREEKEDGAAPDVVRCPKCGDNCYSDEAEHVAGGSICWACEDDASDPELNAVSP